MGKRELLLLVVFVVLGVGVYQVSAPAAPADGPGFSLSRLVQMARSHFSGPAVRRTVTRTATFQPPSDVTTLNLGEIRGAVMIEGADREDIEVRIEAMLGGLDEADLKRQEEALRVELKSEGPEATTAVSFDQTGRTPRIEMHVLMPRRLKAEIAGRGSAEVRGVAALHLDEFRGELTTEDLRGPVTGEMRDARAEFGTGATLDLRAERGRVRADAPLSVTLDISHANLDIVDPAGPITLKQEQCRIDIRGTGGAIKVTGEGGTIVLRQITHPLTIEAERLTVNAEFDAPVATVIAVENDDVEVTLPRSGGVELNAEVTYGELRLPDGLTATTADDKQSYAGKVAGGGPLVKLALERGTMRIRSRGAQSGT
jgi:hypothetical protein